MKKKKCFPWKGLLFLLLLSGVGAIVYLALKKPETLNQFKDSERRQEFLNATVAQTRSKWALLFEAFQAGRQAAKEAHAQMSAEAEKYPVVSEEKN